MNTEPSIEELQRIIEIIDSQIAPLVRQKKAAEDMLKKRRSAEFIRANGITRDNVELSRGDGKPWFGTIYSFANWLRDLPVRKRFCEWNGWIYLTNEIINGKMDPNPVATINELPATASERSCVS